jgi:AraC family transcriptional regulator
LPAPVPAQAARMPGGDPTRVVTFMPAMIAWRRSIALTGLRVETVAFARDEPFEYCFHGPQHLLVVSEQAERHEGDTRIESPSDLGPGASTQQLSFIPAGHEFRGWQDPKVLARITYVYIDPASPLMDCDPGELQLRPRLFFFDREIWETVLKLKAQIDNPGAAHRRYAEALAVVLAHELVRLNSAAPPVFQISRGGLAGWQQRRVVAHIEEHVTEDIPLAKLAELAGLSRFHFARSFKHSFGVPPHRYHASRRIERAKEMLAQSNMSVTGIALEVGYGETSSFTAAFRRMTGLTPSEYRRRGGRPLSGQLRDESPPADCCRFSTRSAVTPTWARRSGTMPKRAGSSM